MPKSIVVTLGSSLLLVGCCSQPHTTQWEYKVTNPKPGNLSMLEQEEFLNDLGKDGWVLVQKEGENGRFTLKRPR